MKKTIIFLLAVTLLIGACGPIKNKNEEESTYLTTTPLLKDTVINHDYVCQIKAIQHIELRALEKGYIEKIFVDEGQAVKKGQLLFQLIPVVYQAETQKNEAEVSFAEIEYKNTLALADSQIVSKNELALAQAKLKKAQAELALSNAHLSFTQIRAPFDGVVGRFYDVRLGSLVDEGDLLTTLSDNSKIWVYFNVPESEYLDYAYQRKADSLLKVKLQLANDKLYSEDGVVETIEADFNNETGTIAFRAGFNNSNRLLKNGETGNIILPVKLEKALLIPQKATFEILDKKYVYVLTKDNTVLSKEIWVEAEMPHIYVIKKGITNKDKIIVDGLRQIKNGQKINSKEVDMAIILKELNELHAE